MKYALLFVIILCTFGAKAQKWWDYHWDIKAHDRGQLHFILGYGAPRIENKDFDKYELYDSVLGGVNGVDTTNTFAGDGAYNLVGSGPIYASLEYGFTRTFSMLLTASYTNYKASWQQWSWDSYLSKYLPRDYGVIVNDLAFGARFNMHLLTTTVWDLYAGAGVNYTMSTDTSYNRANNYFFNGYYKQRGPIGTEMGLGIRRFFMNRTAAYLEAGYGKSWARAGIVIKITQPKSNRGF